MPGRGIGAGKRCRFRASRHGTNFGLSRAMAFLTRLLIAAALLAAPLLSQESALHLWAVSDGVRVNPVTGQVFEARPDLHNDYPSPDFRSGNSVWNPGAK